MIRDILFYLPADTKIFKPFIEVVETGGFRKHFIGKPIKEKEVDEALKLVEVFIEEMNKEFDKMAERKELYTKYYEAVGIDEIDLELPWPMHPIDDFLSKDDILFFKEMIKLFQPKLNISNVVLVVLKILERRGIKPRNSYIVRTALPFSLKSFYEQNKRLIDRFEYLDGFNVLRREVLDKALELKYGEKRFDDKVKSETEHYLTSSYLIPTKVLPEDNEFALKFATQNWKEIYDFSRENYIDLSTCSLTYTLTFLKIYEELNPEKTVIEAGAELIKGKKVG